MSTLSDWWFNVGPIFWAGIFIGIPVLIGLYMVGSRDPEMTYPGCPDPPCSPSRKSLPTARRSTPGRVIAKPKRTIHTAGKPVRWRELERSVEREKVRR